MKVISYAIFGARQKTAENAFEFYTYMRGLYFNTVMNSLIYPEWRTHIEIDSGTFSEYDNFFNFLRDEYNASYRVNPSEPLCKAMLWRMKPVFDEDVDYVLCRDTDALTTYREAQAVQEFVDSGLPVHGITDNPSHTVPLMGGMIGFKAKDIVERYRNWDRLVSKYDLEQRGSDQVLLAREVYPEFRKRMFAHYIKGMQPNGEAVVKTSIENKPLRGVDPSLYESNFCITFIGAAGCVEFETIRFFKRRGAMENIKEISKKYPLIFNWCVL